MVPFSFVIPVCPPGINSTYRYGKGKVYLSDEAQAWKTGAALVIGAAAGRANWKDMGGQYKLTILFSRGERRSIDEDAPVKLIQDTVCAKLMHDQKDDRIEQVKIRRVHAYREFVYVLVERSYPMMWTKEEVDEFLK